MDAIATSRNARRLLLTGNEAVAWGARLARPQVCPVYPITPQTPVLEKLTEFQAAGEFDAEIITPESEHSVMSACIPASLAGTRVFTATASQGLLLMHELLHYASGARAPIVMANVNRTVASPWAFWPDQTDSLAQRDTGWVQLYVESAQEALDSVPQAFRVAEQALLPVMINLDAFYVSHAMEPVDVPAQEDVDAYLPPFARQQRLDTAVGSSWGNVVSQDMFYRHRQALQAAMDRVPRLLAEADRRVAAALRPRLGRGRALPLRRRANRGRHDGQHGRHGARSRRRDARCRRAGGVGEAAAVPPFPAAALRAALDGVRDAVVLDRNHSPGVGGILHQELRAALCGVPGAPRVHGLLAGVGGVNVPPGRITAFVRAARDGEPAAESQWVR